MMMEMLMHDGAIRIYKKLEQFIGSLINYKINFKNS